MKISQLQQATVLSENRFDDIILIPGECRGAICITLAPRINETAAVNAEYDLSEEEYQAILRVGSLKEAYIILANLTGIFTDEQA